MWSVLIPLFWVIASCSEDETTPAPASENNVLPASQYVYDAMTQFYLWYDKIPDTIKPADFDDPIALLDAMVYKELDRWTYMVQDDGALADEITQGTVSGVIGVSLAFDADSNLRILYTLPGSPADLAGLKRSDIILKVNGVTPVPGQSISFGEVPELEILRTDGTVETFTLTRADITENPVVHYEVKDIESMKVAYVVYNTFNGLSEEKLNEAFAYFNAQGATELVVDLRYNGGGLVDAAQHLSSLIVPQAHYGDLFIEEQFNDKNTRFNEQRFFEPKDHNVSNLQRVVFLVTGRTASASELVINGLRPYMDVTIIGQNTVGKYVGASLFTFEDYTFIPITFQSVNANNEVFIEGFAPHITANDDITREFGDANEEMFATAIDFLTGNLAGARRSSIIRPTEIVYEESYWKGPAVHRVER